MLVVLLSFWSIFHSLSIDVATLMPNISKRERLALKAMNNGEYLALVCHDSYVDWAQIMVQRLTRNGCLVDLFINLNDANELLSCIERFENGKYTTIVLVPGHGCEHIYKSEMTKKGMIYHRALPGILWHADAHITDFKYLILNKKLEKLTRMLLDKCVHLHICTCYQGNQLDLYESMLLPSRKQSKYVISGWDYAITTSDKQVDKFVSNGCHYYSFHRKNEALQYVLNNK